MEQEKYDKIVKNADQYYCGAKILLCETQFYDSIANFDMYVKLSPPKVTLSCIACEMYLKALIYREKGELPGNKHDLKFLFERISDKDKAWCVQMFNAWISPKSDFDAELIKIKDAFVKWRYLYEWEWTRIDYVDGIIPDAVTEFMELLHQTAHKYIIG